MRTRAGPLLSACCWLLFSTTSLAAVVESARSYRSPDHTRLIFDLSASLEHRVFALDEPRRLVIDLADAELRADFAALDLSNTPIIRIRSARRNDADARVVLDLRQKVWPKSFLLPENQQYGHRLIIDLYDEEGAAAEPAPAAIDIEAPRRDLVVAISAGHGGDDPGAVGVNRLQEKQVVLAISWEIARLLEQAPGYRPVMVRNGDYYVNLRRRIQISRAHKADLFIAIHADAHANSAARGATVYALSERGATSEHARRLAEKENGADLIGGVGSVSLGDKDDMLASVLLDLSMTASIATSLDVGEKIIASLGNVIHLRRTNVEQAAFVVLKSADIPSLLIESGYITNSADAGNLASAAFRKRFARAVVNGITSYFHHQPPRDTWIAWQKENGANPGVYVVSSGDTLSEIAAQFAISTNDLKSLNNLQSDIIRVGQELMLPPGLTNPAVAPMLVHTVARGETLSEIAADYAVPMSRIRELNQLRSDTIYIGQVIDIPSL